MRSLLAGSLLPVSLIQRCSFQLQTEERQLVLEMPIYPHLMISSLKGRNQEGLTREVLAAIQPHCDDIPIFAGGTVAKLIHEVTLVI